MRENINSKVLISPVPWNWSGTEPYQSPIRNFIPLVRVSIVRHSHKTDHMGLIGVESVYWMNWRAGVYQSSTVKVCPSLDKCACFPLQFHVLSDSEKLIRIEHTSNVTWLSRFSTFLRFWCRLERTEPILWWDSVAGKNLSITCQHNRWQVSLISLKKWEQVCQ